MENQIKQQCSYRKNKNYHFWTLNIDQNKHIVFDIKESQKMKATDIFKKVDKYIQQSQNKNSNTRFHNQCLNKSSNDFLDPSNKILKDIRQMQNKQGNKSNKRLKSAMNVSNNSLASSQGFANQNLWNNFNELNRKISKCMLTKKIIENDEKAVQMISDNFGKQSEKLKN